MVVFKLNMFILNLLYISTCQTLRLTSSQKQVMLVRNFIKMPLHKLISVLISVINNLQGMGLNTFNFCLFRKNVIIATDFAKNELMKAAKHVDFSLVKRTIHSLWLVLLEILWND